jgi:hypothetical protein
MAKRSSSEPELWNEQIDTLENAGKSLEQARDIVIVRWLDDGDLRPCIAFVKAGHVPCRGVLLRLLEQVQVKRGCGRQYQQAKHWDRDLYLAAAVMIQMREGLSNEKAIEEVVEASGDQYSVTGKVKSPMVKRAYQKFGKILRRVGSSNGTFGDRDRTRF